jgi:hypothetical protein
VFHTAGEDVLVKVVKAGSVMNVDELVRTSIAEVERCSAKSGKPARHVPRVPRQERQDAEELLDKVSRAATTTRCGSSI